MAVEQLRGCGFRKVGGMYLCGEYISSPCDRMPFPLNPCQLWGSHQGCEDNFRPCHLCDPQDEPAYIMLIGAGNYKTPQDFLEEAGRMGISKRIPFIPKDLELGKTVVYLAHPKACEVKEAAALQQAMAIVERGSGRSYLGSPQH